MGRYLWTGLRVSLIQLMSIFTEYVMYFLTDIYVMIKKSSQNLICNISKFFRHETIEILGF
jgi:hypothetical protein